MRHVFVPNRVFTKIKRKIFRVFIISLFFLCCLLADISLAQNKVVVIPMGGGAMAPDNFVAQRTEVVISGEAKYVSSPTCASGFRLSAGGYIWETYANGASILGSLPANGNDCNISGVNQADRWCVYAGNASVSNLSLRVYAVCTRVPGG